MTEEEFRRHVDAVAATGGLDSLNRMLAGTDPLRSYLRDLTAEQFVLEKLGIRRPVPSPGDQVLADIRRPAAVPTSPPPLAVSPAVYAQLVAAREAWLEEQVRVRLVDVTAERRRCGRCGAEVGGWYGTEPGEHVILEETPPTFASTESESGLVVKLSQDVRLVNCEDRPLAEADAVRGE